MNIWILTIGTSDVQLDSNNTNQVKGRTEKQRSDKVWSYWYNDDLKAQHYGISFQPKSLLIDKDETYRIAPRILGIVYKASSESIQQEIWDYLTFPLLDNFVKNLKDKNTKDPENYPLPEAISVLLTNQSAIFDDRQKRKPENPYWEDTCELEPILQRYFQDRFSNIPCEFMVLTPEIQEQSLDNWNAVLDLVRDQFRVLKIADRSLELSQEETVYISHQAGTPAISSAVQFCSLAKFGDRVKFLVSNKYNRTVPEKPLEGSSYLRGIRIQEAKALLDSHNYAGVEALIASYIEEDKPIKTLLNAAKSWNVAKFDDFLQALTNHPKFTSEVADRKNKENWWWIGYEEAYLAVIREKQDNIVEAFFHSFRAFEYTFAAWGLEKLTDHIEEAEDSSVPFLKETILDDSRFCELTGDRKKAVAGIQSKLKALADKKKHGDKIKNEDKVEFGFFNLCNLFKALNYSDYKGSCSCLNVFFGKDSVRSRRNTIVHQVKGLLFTDLCTYWGVTCPEDLENINEPDKSIIREQARTEWTTKLKNLLNCIVKEDLSQEFSSLEEASLMVKVHQELVDAIENL